VNSAVVDEQFAVYESLKDAIKITRRSVRRGNHDLHSKTALVGETPSAIYERFEYAEAELQDVMIRNWVAHGRNPERQPPARADVRTVATKLTGFLAQFRGVL
jgi:hypothetical protein